MSPINHLRELDALRQKLAGLQAEFERELRARGFDSSQVENVALPSQLAKLYAECEQLRITIEELEGRTND